MKVLFITSCLDAGGAEKWCRDTLMSMNRDGILVDYYFYEGIRNDAFLTSYQDAGIRLFFRELNRRKGGVIVNLSRDLSRFVRENGPYDAAHINGLNLVFQDLLMNVLYGERIPVRIVHSHSSFVTHQNKASALIKRYLRSRIILKATVVGACSVPAGISRYGENIVNHPKFTVIKNGIDIGKCVFDPEIRDKIRSEIDAEGKTVFGFIGRLAAEKNLLFLTEIFANIHRQNPNTMFLFVGSGPEEAAVKAKISDLRLNDSTVFIPWTKHPNDYYNAADVMILPSLNEGFSLVALEAQCSGLPCLVSDKIPKDTNVTHRIVYKSLADSAEQWAETAMQLAKQGRYDGQQEVREAGYDLMDTAAEFRRMLEGKQE